ncbi:MAG: putative phage holin [Mycobacteriaceae bacterium]
MRLLANTLLFIAALGFFAFPVTYHLTSGGLWRYSTVGKALMQFMAVLAGVMVLAVWSTLRGPLPELARVIVWGSICAVTWRQVGLLISVRRRK